MTEAPGESSVQNEQVHEVCVNVTGLSERTYFMENSSSTISLPYYCQYGSGSLIGGFLISLDTNWGLFLALLCEQFNI